MRNNVLRENVGEWQLPILEKLAAARTSPIAETNLDENTTSLWPLSGPPVSFQVPIQKFVPAWSA